MALSVLGVIPARLASTRLPRKVLREIAGRPLVAWVYEAARRAADLGHVLVATDAEEVASVCRRLDIPAVMTSPDHPSGTDRVWEVAQSHPADVYVNVQGDEPFITPAHIAQLVEPFRSEPETLVSTLCIRATPDEVDARQVNKVVFGAGGRALYFSKYGIPFDRDGRGASATSTSASMPTASPRWMRSIACRPRRSRRPRASSSCASRERHRHHRAGNHRPTIGVDTEEDLRAADPS